MIKNANSAIENGQINFNGFLNRVTCKDAKLMEGMLEFENVAEDDGDLEEISDVASTDPTVESSTANKNNLCGTCEANDRDTLLLPCLHVYYCWGCWQKWLRTDPDKFEVENFLDPNDPHLNIENDPQKNPKCPICNEVAKSWKKIRFA